MQPLVVICSIYRLYKQFPKLFLQIMFKNMLTLFSYFFSQFRPLCCKVVLRIVISKIPFGFRKMDIFFVLFSFLESLLTPRKLQSSLSPFGNIYIYINTLEPRIVGFIGCLLCRVFRGPVFGLHVWAPFCLPLNLMQIPETSDKTRYR